MPAPQVLLLLIEPLLDPDVQQLCGPTFDAYFVPKGKYTVTIDDLFTIAVVDGLINSQFQYMTDRQYADHFPKFAEVNMVMKLYDLDRQKAKSCPTAMAATAASKPICTA